MILQYKGFNNNWTYQEAESITWSNVCVGKETRDYREGGVRYKFYLEDRANSMGLDTVKIDMQYVKEMHGAVDRLIRKETKTGTSEIVYLLGDTKFDHMENVCVVIMSGKNINVTYVFTDGVYILNNNGGTVQKIA